MMIIIFKKCKRYNGLINFDTNFTKDSEPDKVKTMKEGKLSDEKKDTYGGI